MDGQWQDSFTPEVPKGARFVPESHAAKSRAHHNHRLLPKEALCRSYRIQVFHATHAKQNFRQLLARRRINPRRNAERFPSMSKVNTPDLVCAGEKSGTEILFLQYNTSERTR